ncbi:MAG: metal ABC transporter permease [Burkholderiaceae bacterium]
MSVLAALWVPFDDYGFMRRALAGCIALSLGASPLGTVLLLRRISLVGDALSHAILPGVAAGYFLFGLSLPAMAAGGLTAGLIVAGAAGLVSRFTAIGEDASLAAFCLISLALGVMLVSLRGSNVDLLHVLFGSVLALSESGVVFSAMVATASLFALAICYRPLLIECFDPEFARALGWHGALAHAVFIVLLVFNLISGVQSLGTLLVVAFLVLPAAAARFWVRSPAMQMALAALAGVLGSYGGLLLSYHLGLAPSSAITLCLGALYVASLVVGRQGSLAGWRGRAAARA